MRQRPTCKGAAQAHAILRRPDDSIYHTRISNVTPAVSLGQGTRILYFSNKNDEV
jgi:hypothetical protein